MWTPACHWWMQGRREDQGLFLVVHQRWHQLLLTWNPPVALAISCSSGKTGSNVGCRKNLAYVECVDGEPYRTPLRSRIRWHLLGPSLNVAGWWSLLWVQRVYLFRFWKFSILCTIDAIDLKLASKNAHCFTVCTIPWAIVWFWCLAIFLQRRHWNLEPGFISISPARMIRINKFVLFEGLKLRSPSELLQFPSFLILAQNWDSLLSEFL